MRSVHARQPDKSPVVALGLSVQVSPAAHWRVPHACVRHVCVAVPEPERLAQHGTRPAHMQLPQEGAPQAPVPRAWMHPQQVHGAAPVQAAERRQRPRRARLHKQGVVSCVHEHGLGLGQQQTEQAPGAEAVEEMRHVVQELAVRLVQLPQHVPQRLRPVHDARLRRNRKDLDLLQIEHPCRRLRLHPVPYPRQKRVRHCVSRRLFLTSGSHVFFAQDRPDLIKSELAGLAFDSLQQVFRKADIERMFNSEALALVQDQTVWIVIDPAAGGPSSDYAVVSIVRQRGTVTVRLSLCASRDAVRLLARAHKVLHGLPRAEVGRHELVAQVLQEAPDLRPVALVHVQDACLQWRVDVQQQVENREALRVRAAARDLQHLLQLRARRLPEEVRAQRGHGVLNERLQEPRVHGVRDLFQHVRDRVVALATGH